MQKKNNLLRLILSTVINLPPEEPEAPPPPLDPDAVAELDGSIIIGRRRDMMPRPTPAPIPVEIPVDQDGHVSLDKLYALANVPAAKFTAEQAMEAVSNVEKTIPDNIPAPSRKPMIKAMLAALSKSTNGASPESIALDASIKIEALQEFVRERSSDLVDLTQAADDAIKSLEAQIDAKKQLKEVAQAQFDHLSKECQDEQDKLNAVIDLLSVPDGH
jgi:hypothetical protein